MEVDGFNQAEYDQLVSNVRSGAPPARTSLFVTLPIPRRKCPRRIEALDSSSEIDGEDGDAETVEVLGSPQKTRLRDTDLNQ